MMLRLWLVSGLISPVNPELTTIVLYSRFCEFSVWQTGAAFGAEQLNTDDGVYLLAKRVSDFYR